ncbi:transglycosylase SLT domain-containing protein [Candidatus Woesebacteria bacterium]|nr:transglycosylase SLT domain-containing protein [Candidatus Woesebacteria bacterium]
MRRVIVLVPMLLLLMNSPEMGSQQVYQPLPPLPTPQLSVEVQVVLTQQATPPTPTPPVPQTVGALSSVFTPEVDYWSAAITRWSAAHGIQDPNLVAILMQVESCGYQDWEGASGGKGLFQVLPFHFEQGEAMLDPETNAYRALLFFSNLYQQTNEIGLVFAGYNGGPSVMVRSWDTWPNETMRYFRWTTGIYQDIKSGAAESETLQRWLEAGGSTLCAQAAARQQQSPAPQ